MIEVGDKVRPRIRYSSSEEMKEAYMLERFELLNYPSLVFEEYMKLLNQGEWLKVCDVVERRSGNSVLRVVLPDRERYFGDMSYYFLTSSMEKYSPTETEIV